MDISKSENMPPFKKIKNADGTEDIYYSVFYEGIPDKFNAVALKELNETEENKKKGIQKLRDVLKKEDISGVDDYTIIAILRNCKYNVKRSEKKLLNFLRIREKIIESLRKKDMKRLESVLDHNIVGLLPYRDKHGKVIFFTTPNADYDGFDMEDAFACYCSLLLYILSFPLSTISGLIYIAECKPSSVYLLYSIIKLYSQNINYIFSIPFRLSKIEILNEISIVRWGVNLMKPLLSSKSVGRISLHGNDVRKLQESYHPDILPAEFGGTLGPLNTKIFKSELLNFMNGLKANSTRVN